MKFMWTLQNYKTLIFKCFYMDNVDIAHFCHLQMLCSPRKSAHSVLTFRCVTFIGVTSCKSEIIAATLHRFLKESDRK